ncbi:hypothetical protein [Roseimaritima ulvae]|uniref:hypothetical protein n=1 Tax=Roseimaritima ulvae TaxID=980254 RepID=UPI0012FB0DD2|nr:hypothetical protein [Roseimaritima ulvae]
MGTLQTVQADEPKADKVQLIAGPQKRLVVYGVGDLVRRLNPARENGDKPNSGPNAVEEFVPLMNFIQTKIAPESWESLGGDGTMAPYLRNRSIVIDQTREVHDQIMLELGNLRKAYRVLDEFEQLSVSPADPAP